MHRHSRLHRAARDRGEGGRDHFKRHGQGRNGGQHELFRRRQGSAHQRRHAGRSSQRWSRGAAPNRFRVSHGASGLLWQQGQCAQHQPDCCSCWPAEFGRTTSPAAQDTPRSSRPHLLSSWRYKTRGFGLCGYKLSARPNRARVFPRHDGRKRRHRGDGGGNGNFGGEICFLWLSDLSFTFSFLLLTDS